MSPFREPFIESINFLVDFWSIFFSLRYFLGLDFEHAVDHNSTGAQFDKKTRKLTVTIAVGDPDTKEDD